MTFDEWWMPQVEAAEVPPSPEEEGYARAAWKAALERRVAHSPEVPLEYASNPEGVFTQQCSHGSCGECPDVDGNCCECSCHLRLA